MLPEAGGRVPSGRREAGGEIGETARRRDGETASTSGTVRHIQPSAFRLPPSASAWAAAAAIMLLISAGLLIWNLRLQEQIAATVPETIALAPTDAAPSASGEVRYDPAAQLFLLDVRGLPPLEPDQVYEVWLIGGEGAPVPAGTFDQSTDQHAIIADRGQFDTLAITAEPGPLGTAAPTGEIVATATL
jgi:anti-sigma-K factor RskA